MTRQARPTKDEFTEKMHSEFKIDKDTEKRFRVYSFLDGIQWIKSVSREEQLEEMDLSEADVLKYQSDWERLKNK